MRNWQSEDQVLYCNDKRAYTKKGAITAANKRFKEAHEVLRIYECDIAPHWHLTKMKLQNYLDKVDED